MGGGGVVGGGVVGGRLPASSAKAAVKVGAMAMSSAVATMTRFSSGRLLPAAWM
ncbi:MAG: hypothetical protein DDT34_01557 [Firmicutes bacterium]|nr:hypothetical protein [Bacillota bacterium]